MNTCKIINKSITGLLIWLVIVTGLAAAQGEAGKLTLSLQPSLDGDGSIKATSIMKAELSNPDGTFVMKTATIIGGKAQFDLSGVVAGDYFIRVNDLGDDLVPTRIDDASKTIDQFVGQKLRVSVIGNLSDPAYKIETFSRGQGEHAVVEYSDGETLTPERYAYVILSLKTSPQKLEVRILGQAAEINSYAPGMATHPSTPTSTNPPFSTWMISETSHANDYKGNDSKCGACHVNMDTKPATFSGVLTTSGWCYRCHYGKGGVENGFIDVTVISTPVETRATPTATTATPTATPKVPAFEAFLAISALLAAILVRRR